MRFVSVRELRNSPGQVWKRVRSEDLVVTASGKPVGILVGVHEERVDETLQALRRARAALAVSRMRKSAAAGGSSRLSRSQIDAEIHAYRRGRRRA